MNLPRVTVITPNYNQGRFIERAICSVLDQGYDNLEYFVIDGGSTDDSVEIIRLYEDELAGWASEPDAGPAEAMNKGLKWATGDIVAFLPSDDIFLPGALTEAVKRMTADDAPQWVVGQCNLINESDQMKTVSQTRSPWSLASFLMHDSGSLPLAASFLSRKLMDAHGCFDAQMYRGFDYEYWCRLLASGLSPEVIPQVVAARREQAGSRSATAAVRTGLEYISAARRYTERLTLAQRCALWANCDTRRRIYTLVEAEMRNGQGRRFLWQQILRHPWWVANDAVRHALMHGIDHSLPGHDALRPAA